jgi:anti-sigma factor RsiW
LPQFFLNLLSLELLGLRWRDGVGLLVILMPEPYSLNHGDAQLWRRTLPPFIPSSFLSIKLLPWIFVVRFVLAAVVAEGATRRKICVRLLLDLILALHIVAAC